MLVQHRQFGLCKKWDFLKAIPVTGRFRLNAMCSCFGLTEASRVATCKARMRQARRLSQFKLPCGSRLSCLNFTCFVYENPVRTSHELKVFERICLTKPGCSGRHIVWCWTKRTVRNRHLPRQPSLCTGLADPKWLPQDSIQEP